MPEWDSMAKIKVKKKDSIFRQRYEKGHEYSEVKFRKMANQ